MAVLGVVGLASAPALAGEGNGLRGEISLGAARLGSLRVSPLSQPQVIDASSSGGATVGASIEARRPHLVAGGNLDCVFSLWNQNEYFLGGHGGWVYGDDRVEMDMVGEAGVHILTNLGADFLTDTDAPRAMLPYAGARVGFLRRRGPGRADPGLWIFVRADLGRTTAVAHTSVFTDHETIPYDVGGYTAGVAFRLAFGG